MPESRSRHHAINETATEAATVLRALLPVALEADASIVWGGVSAEPPAAVDEPLLAEV
jgi:hypothetical protein